MYENIRLNNSNFCIGPQTGTYCSVDNTVSPVVMHVKTELGSLIRTYSFSPSETFKVAPYLRTALDSEGYFPAEFITIKYIGPRDLSSYFTGAVFYTLEKRAKLIRTYYTYQREPEIGGEYKTVGDKTFKFNIDSSKGSGVIKFVASRGTVLTIGAKLKLQSINTSQTDGVSEYVYISGVSFVRYNINNDLYTVSVESKFNYPAPYFDYTVDDDIILLGSLVTAERPEYSSVIIRKWVLDATNFRLMLDRTIVKNSDDSYWFDVGAFAIEHYVAPLINHCPKGFGIIELNSSVASKLSKYDKLMIGPSTDTDNVGAIEEVNVYSVDGTVVEVRTDSDYIPTKFDYVINNNVTLFNDILLFSNSRPLINESGIAYGFTSNSGVLYHIDQTRPDVIDKYVHSGLYSDVTAADWNQTYGTLSFIKGSNLLHLSLADYEVYRSQAVGIVYPITNEFLTVYDLIIKDTVVYKLQSKVIKRDDVGEYALVNWLTYNFQTDSLVPYTYSATIIASNRVSFRGTVTYLLLHVRDQFGVGVLNKNVWFSTGTDIGDTAAVFVPTDGYVITDADGYCSVRYDAGYNYDGMVGVYAKIDGSNMTHGSAFVITNTKFMQYSNFNSSNYLVCNFDIPDSTLNMWAVSGTSGQISMIPRLSLMFPNDVLGDESKWREYKPAPIANSILVIVYVPFFEEYWTGSNIPTPPEIRLDMYNSKLLFSSSDSMLLDGNGKNLLGNVVYYMWNTLNISNTLNMSNNFVSRHVDYGNSASVNVDQFSFMTETRPAMWSEKNNVDTDFWVRLRPFASSLAPGTLVIKLKEISYLGEGPWYDITDLGIITMYDAGGGLFGIDFLYIPPSKFHNNAVVYVYIEVYDTSFVPNLTSVSYWFKLIPDFKAPYIDNHFPAVDSADVNIHTDIMFDLIDTGEGTDITTLEIYINNRQREFTYIEYEPGNYHVTCAKTTPFNYNQEVTILVDVKDRSENKNRLYDGWKFYCADSTGPWFNLEESIPARCIQGAKKDQVVELQVYAVDDTGIDPESIVIDVDGKNRNVKLTPIVYRLN